MTACQMYCSHKWSSYPYELKSTAMVTEILSPQLPREMGWKAIGFKDTFQEQLPPSLQQLVAHSAWLDQLWPALAGCSFSSIMSRQQGAESGERGAWHVKLASPKLPQ